MAIILGTRLYGRTDEVEGLGYVAHSFFHVNFVPLIPMGETYLVVKHSLFSQHQEVVRIKNALRPVLIGYARGAAWTTALLTSLFAFLNVAYVLSSGEFLLGSELCLFVASCMALVLLYFPRRLRQASPERAWELAAESGVGAIEIADLIVDPEPVRRVEVASEERAASAVPSSRRREERIRIARAVATSTRNAVKFACPSCEATNKVSTAHVGKRGLCKSCGVALRVPAPLAKPSRGKRARSRVEAGSSWRAPEERPRRRRSHRQAAPPRPQPVRAVLGWASGARGGWASADAPLGLE